MFVHLIINMPLRQRVHSRTEISNPEAVMEMRVSSDEGVVLVELSNGDFGVMFLDAVRSARGERRLRFS